MNANQVKVRLASGKGQKQKVDLQTYLGSVQTVMREQAQAIQNLQAQVAILLKAVPEHQLEEGVAKIEAKIKELKESAERKEQEVQTSTSVTGEDLTGRD